MAYFSRTGKSRLSSAVAKALSVKPRSVNSPPYSRRGFRMVEKANGGPVKRVPFMKDDVQTAVPMRTHAFTRAQRLVFAAEEKHALNIAPR